MNQTEEKDRRTNSLYQKLTSFDVEQALLRMGEDYDLYVQVLRSFEKMFRNFPDTLRKLAKACDSSQIHQELHTLKGVAANLESTEISRHLQLLTEQLIPGEEILAIEEIERFELTLKRSFQQILSLEEPKEKQTDEAISKQELIVKLHGLKTMLADYDAGVSVYLAEIKPGLFQMGLKEEAIRLERTAARYAFDDALAICKRLLDALGQV